MTIGFLLLFTGAQLSLVDSYVLTPRASKFWAEKMNSSDGLIQTVYEDGYVPPQSGLTGQQVLNPQSRLNPQSNFANNAYQSGYGGSPFQNTGYQAPFNANPILGSANGPVAALSQGPYPPKRIIPPDWLCWPAICLGAVLFLYGAAFKR